MLWGVRRSLRPHPTERFKGKGAWTFFVGQQLAVTVTVACPGRTEEELLAPIPVHVHEADLVDTAELQPLVERGVALVRMEARPR